MVKLFNIIFFIITVFVIYSCGSKVSDKNDKKDDDLKMKESSIDCLSTNRYKSPPLTLDVLDIDSLTIRGHKLNVNINKFNKVWRESDSIKSYFAETGPLEGKTVKSFYNKGAVFELYDDRASLVEIDFTKSNEKITYNKLIFDKETLYGSLSMFKNSCKIAKRYKKSNDEIIKVEFLTKKEWDEHIFLVFKNEKLIEFYFYEFP
jgi:hypothetical protein